MPRNATQHVQIGQLDIRQIADKIVALSSQSMDSPMDEDAPPYLKLRN
jgi:hypothetical protein